jgi:hypothetical protein
MGRFKRPRHRRSTLYAVKETVAALNEELEFTLKYAHAMTRDENYQAAVEVIAEQQRSLARASKRMREAVVEPDADRGRFRVRAALAGVAATVAIASGAIAGHGGGTLHSEKNPGIRAIRQATAALTEATAISDPVAFQALALQAQERIIGIAIRSPSDPALQLSLLDSVEELREVARNPNVSAKVREQAKKVADKVEEAVVLVPEAPEAPEAPEESTADEPAPAPAPSPSV